MLVCLSSAIVPLIASCALLEDTVGLKQSFTTKIGQPCICYQVCNPMTDDHTNDYYYIHKAREDEERKKKEKEA